MDITIAVDAMGGDFAPIEVVKGAVEYVSLDSELKIILVGHKETIQTILQQECHIDHHDRIEVVHASQVIGMDETPVKALKTKKDSSIAVAARLVKEGRAQSLVSLGNTGVLVASSTLTLRHLKKVKRCGIAVPLPTLGDNPCIIMDMGANVNCKAENLAQYAQMASIYAREVFSIANPKVGLLNVGEETEKGNELVKESYSLLEEAPINFVGNVEGRDIYTGEYDVIVCDGFVGNVVLKTSEGLAAMIMKALKANLKASMRTKVGAYLSMPAFKKLKTQLDHTEWGGAIVLGLNGTVIVGHGSSKADSVRNAIKCAHQSIKHSINEKIVEELSQ